MKTKINGRPFAVTLEDETKARLLRLVRARNPHSTKNAVFNDTVALGGECDHRARLVRRILDEATLMLEEAIAKLPPTLKDYERWEAVCKILTSRYELVPGDGRWWIEEQNREAVAKLLREVRSETEE